MGTSFSKNFIVNDLNRFSESMKESYNLEEIDVRFEEKNDYAEVGFNFSKNGNDFIAFIKRERLQDNTFEVKRDESWVLQHNNNEYSDKLLTIGMFMDKVDDILESK